MVNVDSEYATLKKGSFVKINGNKVKLGKLKGKGGEGEIFDLPQNRVTKIYVEEKAKISLLPEKNRLREAKLSYIIGININDSEIAIPIALIYDLNCNFRGYEMPRVSGESLEKLMSSPIPTERWKGWTRKNLVEACLNIVNILNRVYTIPEHEILIGDLNLGNFVSPSPGKVVLIDFDSVQIDNYPCPVGQDKFSPPEILKIETSRSNIVHQKCNEEFSVAVLLFYILCGGIHPFSKKGGDSPKTNILDGFFPYNEDGTVSEVAPLAGNPNYYWAFLPQEIRKAFCDTFNAKDKNDRTSVVQWSSLFARYLNEFDSNVVEDSEANNIILTRYPKWEKPKGTEECLACHQAKPVNQIFDHLCYVCLTKGYKVDKRKCMYCGALEYDVVFGNQGFKNHSDFVCSTCLKEETLTCYVCNNQFTTKHFEEKKYFLEGKIVCRECSNRFNQIRESILNFKTINRNLPSFEKIPFVELFEDLEKKAEEDYIPFLGKMNNGESKQLLRTLCELLFLYQEQAVEFVKYQNKLKEINKEEKTPVNLQASVNSYIRIKDEIRDKVVFLEKKGQKREFAWKDLPYYCFFNEYLEKKIIVAEAELKKVIHQKTKYAYAVLSEVKDSFLPEKFYSVNFDKQLSSIESAIKSLNEIQDYPKFKKTCDELVENRRKIERGKELKEKTEEYVNCNVSGIIDRRMFLCQIRERRKQLNEYRNVLGNTLCDHIADLLNQQENKIIQTYKNEPIRILNEYKYDYTLEEFYSTDFNRLVLRIDSSLKLLAEVQDYVELQELYHKLIACQAKIKRMKFFRKKTEKYFKCNNEIDIQKAEEALLEITELSSQISNDSSCLSNNLRESILETLRQRESEIEKTSEFLSFYASLKTTKGFTILNKKELLLTKTPDYIKGFNAVKIHYETEKIYSIFKDFENALKKKDVRAKYLKVQAILESAEPYSEYSFFDDIKDEFQKITKEYNSHIQWETKVEELTTEYTIKRRKLVLSLVVAFVCLISVLCFLITHFVNLTDGILNIDDDIFWLFWKLWIVGIASLIIGMISCHYRKR